MEASRRHCLGCCSLEHSGVAQFPNPRATLPLALLGPFPEENHKLVAASPARRSRLWNLWEGLPLNVTLSAWVLTIQSLQNHKASCQTRAPSKRFHTCNKAPSLLNASDLDSTEMRNWPLPSLETFLVICL